MEKKIRGLHSSPGVYTQFTDIEYGNIINKGRKIMKSTDGTMTSGGGGGTPGHKPVDYSKEYFTITALEDNVNVYFGYTNFGGSGQAQPKTIEYSTDKKNWVSVTSLEVEIGSGFVLYDPFTILQTGEKIYLRGENDSYGLIDFSGGPQYSNIIMCLPDGVHDSSDITDISDTRGIYDVSGNIMSLVYGDDFKDKTELTAKNDCCFSCLFYYNVFLGDISNLILPATTLSKACYYMMFSRCVNITSVPKLPAGTLTEYCYAYMFQECMKLNFVECLATDISASGCTYYWLEYVNEIGVFIKDENMEDWEIGYNGIPESWSVAKYGKIEAKDKINTDGYLTFTNSIDNCYFGVHSFISEGSISTHDLFISEDCEKWMKMELDALYTYPKSNTLYVCGKLNAVDDLPWSGATHFLMNGHVTVSGNINSILDYENLNKEIPDMGLSCLFFGSTALVDASDLEFSSNPVPVYGYHAMFSNCYSLVYAPRILPAMELGEECYGLMFSGCTNLITVPELPATEITPYCYKRMFEGCTSLTTAPVLPATTLVNNCYEYMFSGCTSLNYIKCLATDISASSCTYDWVNGVSATGTFVKNPSMTRWTSGGNGIPNGWTIENA